MSELTVRAMALNLTVPFLSGADTLPVALAGGTASTAPVAPYDFAEHVARFDTPARPRYVIVTQIDLTEDVQVTLEYQAASGSGKTSQPVLLPAGTLAGASFAIDLGADEGPDTVLRALHVAPGVPTGNAADAFRIVALLGNLAKLLWVIGWERDHLRAQMERVRAQRHLSRALGGSLDLIGDDLGVPRFPALPYAFDPDTLAQYHLDDLPGATPAVADDMARYRGGVGHAGSINGPVGFLPTGRFGRAFLFRDPNAEVQILDDPAFALAAGQSFTVEAFVRPDRSTPDKPIPDGHVIAKHANPGAAGQAGWALSIGEFGRGLRRNVRFLLGDGVKPDVLLFADISLPSDRFQHVAGVVDGIRKLALLYLEGVLVASASLNELGAIANGEPIRFGRTTGGAYQGALDEVRMSGVARSSFFPVLGESDASYRSRLAIFRHWTLPTRDDLTQLLNSAVGKIGGDAAPLVVDDVNSPVVAGSQVGRVAPALLPPGRCIAANGDRTASEADASGEAERNFDPVFLVIHSGPIVYEPPQHAVTPGMPAADSHRMQVNTAKRLDALIALLAAQAGGLHVVSAFDPEAGDLRAVGRALVLRHKALPADALAALAFRAGFDFICNRTDLQAVYASVAPGDLLDVRNEAGGSAAPGNGFDLLVGQTLNLAVTPAPAADAIYRWVLVGCGAGQAELATLTGRTKATLTAIQPGQVAIKVEVTRARRTISATRILRIGPAPLADAQSIGADGALGVQETVAAGTDPFFHPGYLVTFADPKVSAANVNARRVHPAVARHLSRLVRMLPGAGTLNLVQGWQPNAADLSGVGRTLTISHSTVPPEQLAVLAHAAGFTFVRRTGAQVFISQAPEDLLTVAPEDALVEKLTEGASTALSVSPRAVPVSIAVSGSAAFVVNSGTDTVSQIDLATNQVAQLYKVGWGPVAAALSTDSKTLYVAELAGSSVSAITLSNGQIQNLSVPGKPTALAVHPAQPKLYVACPENNTLVEINTATFSIARTVAVGNKPSAAAVTPNGTEVWVTLLTDKRVAVVDTTSFTVASNVSLPDGPASLAVAPNGSRAYVTLPATNRLALVNVSTHALIGAPLDLGSAPSRVAVSPDSSTVYVTDALQFYALKLDGSPQASLRLGSGSSGVTADAGHVYITNALTDIVSVVDVRQVNRPSLAITWRLGSGLGENLLWTVAPPPITGAAPAPGVPGPASLDSSKLPQVTLTAGAAGMLLVQALYTLPGGQAPYTFEVKLKPALDIKTTVIRKDQYDLIMNILNAVHPVGVEVITRNIRDHVIELTQDQINAFPDYTFPNFRVRGRASRKAGVPSGPSV